MTGIFISRNGTFTLSGLSMVVHEDGTVEMSTPKALISYDVCPIWLEIAVGHLESATIANEEMKAAWGKTDDNPSKGETLEQVFQYSMQAITASAIAIDGFYAAIQKKAEIDPTLVATWREKKTARHAQVSETIRNAYQLKAKGFDALRDAIKQIYKFRDQAVHPSIEMEEAALHSDLRVGVERRFEVFRYDNAYQIVRTTVSMIDELARRGRAKNDEVKKYSAALGVSTEPLRLKPLLNLAPLKPKDGAT